MKLTLIALAGAVAGLAACAQPYPAPAPGVDAAAVAPAGLASSQCFRSQDIRNHTVGDPSTLYLKVSQHDVYRVDMRGSCLAGATSSDPLIMRQPPGTPRVCRPIDLDISISRGGFASPCIVGAITLLTPEQAAALPPRVRP